MASYSRFLLTFLFLGALAAGFIAILFTQQQGEQAATGGEPPAIEQVAGGKVSLQPTPNGTNDDDLGASTDDQEVSDDALKKQALGEEDEASLDLPTFDVVRVERSGDTLIAGQGTPGAKILIEGNGEVIAETVADETGAFVALPSRPLIGDNTEVAIRVVKPDGNELLSEQKVAIAATGDDAPLVALLEPGKPVEILQKVEPEVVASGPVAEGAQTAGSVEAPSIQNEAGEASSVASKTDRLEGATEQAGEESQNETKQVARISKTEVEKHDGRVSEQTLEEQETAVLSSNEEVKKSIEQDAASIPSENDKSANEVAGTTEENTPTSKQSDGRQITVDAVEVDKDKIFVAGDGEPGSTVRVYVDDVLVGDTKTNTDGRWLLEDKKELASGEYTVRVDQLVVGRSDVEKRAEVPFVIEEKSLANAKAKPGDTIIIRSNDNLWTIARRLYGDGLKYTAIYRQNQDQIKNPDLIFPGQIFTLPDPKGLSENPE